MPYEADDGPLSEDDLARLDVAAAARRPRGKVLWTRSLLQDEGIVSWLRAAVGRAYQALQTDPSRALYSDEIRASLQEQAAAYDQHPENRIVKEQASQLRNDSCTVVTAKLSQ